MAKRTFWTAVTAATALTVGTIATGVLTAPSASANPTDPVTGCQEVYDSAVVGNTPIAFSRIVDELPQKLAVSRLTVTGGVASVTTRTTPLWLGQKTPYMDGLNTRDYKNYSSGSAWWTDHWWDSGFTRHTVGCQTNMPFVVGPASNEATTPDSYAYNGTLFGRDAAWKGKGNWWAFPKNYSREGVNGFSTWTCRGAVDPAKSLVSQVWWSKVDQGSGFFGDNDTDRVNPNAGRAPKCDEPLLEGMTIRPSVSQTYYGSLDSRTATGCEYASAQNSVGCWNQIYKGPWNRSWRTLTHVFAIALRTQLQSSAQIEIPADYSPSMVPETRRLSWAITDAKTSGAWPISGKGIEDATIPGPKEYSPFTVPGSLPGKPTVFNVGTYGDITKVKQSLSFRLTATTDGTWDWPVNAKGEELLRPSAVITVSFDLANFDYQGTSCASGPSYSSNENTKDNPCLNGFVPTIYKVSDNLDQNQRRQPLLDDKKNPISTADWKFEPVAGGWQTSDLKAQQLSFEVGGQGGGYVGANAKWTISLSGTITNLQ